jgi:cephalosporin hydroxylase
MFPFWDDVIAPLIEAAGARRVIEIGALRGETTVRMLHGLGPDCELHVIDPVPQFDPTEHERSFAGRYFFHLGISHDVLPALPPADVVLIDGDHNWYTVYNELKLLADTARHTATALPLLIAHDVGWPYGRRDLYYEPSRIPDEYRHRYWRYGMQPGFSGLRLGGMNVELANADHEGGPRNGVFTAIEDFIAEYERPLRLLVLPLYFGLAIIVEEAVIAEHPALGELLDRFDSVESQRKLVELGERIRIDEVISSQTWLRALNERIARSAARYLAVVKAALLDEHYLDNEVRIDYLHGVMGRQSPDLSPLRDPTRLLQHSYQRMKRARLTGEPLDADDRIAFGPYSDMGRAQLDRLEGALDHVRIDAIDGDLAEIGVGRGGGAIFMRAYLDAHEMEGRKVWAAGEFLATQGADLHQVRDGFDHFGVLDDAVRFLQGPPGETLAHADLDSLALVRFGAELGPALEPALTAVLPHLSSGAVVVVAGTGDPAVEAAVEDWRRRFGVDTPLERIDWNSVTWTVPDRASAAASVASPASTETVALSVVVVFYNMRREARRTLQSLSRSYQRGVENLSYEVIAIDNGSSREQRLSEAEVRSYGPEFRLLEMGDAANPSPTAALNAGLARARGENIALMIDGAHVLTPGVLHHAMLGLAAYEPAVVAAQQWYVGPGQQPDAAREGYDQELEDKLFEQIQWPTDGYRLFEVGHFIGERDWFDGIVESNCIVAPRKLLEQVGAFDERFSMPGAGYANLDLFERLALAPGVTVASLLGEGTFHQFHGGTTTNVVDPVEHRERVASYGQHFFALRGRALLGLDRSVKYVGSLSPNAAKRTRARRPFQSLGVLRDPVQEGAEGAPVPVADELKLAAIDAIWDRKAWKDATWLGRRVNRYPSDLQCAQELLAQHRPDVVIVTGDDDGLVGRALFVASILDLVDHGHVVAVGADDTGERPEHARLTYVTGRADDAEVAAQVRSRAEAQGDAMVFLALGDSRRVINAFEHYASLVPVGGYVVVENTVVNGRPAAAGFGAGPLEAVFRILAAHPDFVSDHGVERYTITFNRDGYLRRMEPK